ncbi:MAG: tetratricopeptide repeat protein [Candidatus Omnitrophota bacterium]|jgi:tetratricopeptide (TPR) repeat protein
MMPALNRKYILSFVAVLCWTCWALGPTLQNGFVNYDDDAHLLQNPFITSLDAPHVRLMFSTTVNKTYIPLSLVSFAWEYAVWRLNPFVFHLHNLLLHLMNTALVILLARFFGLPRAAGLLAGLIFGVHPMHVESVAWVTERKDVLYTLFYLLAVTCYVMYLSRAGLMRPTQDVPLGGERRPVRAGARFFTRSWWVMALVCGVLSALSKPMALSLPFILLLLDWYFGRRFTVYAWVEKFICGALLFPVVWITYALHIRSAALSFPEALLTWLWCLTFHLKKFFYPDFFVVFYAPPFPVTIHNGSLLQGVLFSGVLVVTLIVFRRHRLFILAFSWYLLSAFFLFRFDYGADSHIVADRFMYLPSLGFCYWVAWIIFRWYQSCQGKRIYQALILTGAVVMLVFLSVQTRKQTTVWKDGIALWKHQIETHWEGQPGLIQALVLTKYADALAAQDDFVLSLKSLRAYDKGTLANKAEEGPGMVDAERVSLAVGYYLKALKLRPYHAPASFGLGRIFYQLGQISLAEKYLKQAIMTDPGHFNAFLHLGKIYFDTGRVEDALDAFRKAEDVNPGNQKVLNDIIKEYGIFLSANPDTLMVERELNRLQSR